jgi:hypothetical protein
VTQKLPPSYVPTLTEVVQPAPGTRESDVTSMLSEEQLVHRVMRRVERDLDARLREAIAAVVLEQTRLLGPMLRDEISHALREAVAEAVAEERAGAPLR